MDARPVVFALVLGWIGRDAGTPPTLVDWLTAREHIPSSSVVSADCIVGGDAFELRQVLLDTKAVSGSP